MLCEGNRNGVLPIIAISFCWLTPAHPDPEGLQLATVVSVLERELPKYARAKDSFSGVQDMGIFWDWASLSQKDSALWAPCCGGPTFVEPAERDQAQVLAADRYEASRTEEEKAGFHFALHETMDLWYSSMRTRAPQSTC